MQVPMKKTITLLFAACFAVTLAGCGRPSLTEISRISNPPNSVDAVVAMRNTDATVATPTEIYLIPIGAKADGDPVFRADHVDALHVSWEGTDKIVIQAKEARPFVSLTNYQVRLSDGSMKQIAIRTVIQKLIN